MQPISRVSSMLGINIEMMKKTGLLFVLLLLTVTAGAQQTLVDHLEREVPGKGIIKVDRDARLDSLIGTTMNYQAGTLVKATGYRIQVYAGNNTRHAKEQAQETEKFIRMNYPQLPVYTLFKSPRWLCTVGDFLYYEEAYEVMRKLKRETPYKGLIILRNQEINVYL